MLVSLLSELSWASPSQETLHSCSIALEIKLSLFWEWLTDGCKSFQRKHALWSNLINESSWWRLGVLCMGPGLSEWFENVRISSTQGNKMNCAIQVPLNRNRGETLPLLTNGGRFISLSQCERAVCSSSKPRIWIHDKIIYLGFTLMEYSPLEPSEILP